MWILLVMNMGLTPSIMTQEFVSERACLEAHDHVLEVAMTHHKPIFASCVHDSDTP